MEKKQLGEANKALALLFEKLNGGQIAPEIVGALGDIVNALAARNFPAANAAQSRLADHHWNEHKAWLKGTKFLIQLCSKRL